MQDSITIEGVPVRMYGYSMISTDCTPTSSADSAASSSTTTVPDAQPGDSYKFCVLFQNNECMAVSSSTVSGGRTLILSIQQISILVIINILNHLYTVSYSQ